MANITYTISTDGSNPILQGSGWSGTITGVTLTSTPASSVPTAVSGDVYSFIPNATNGYKVYASTTDENHYLTFRSQNIATQYPSSGRSLDIWSALLYTDISGGKTWQGLIDGGLYPLNNVKYTLMYDYTPGSPTSLQWVRGGVISFVEG